MLLFGIFRLNVLFTFEVLALIAALFLLIHISRQQLSKWYRYAAWAIIVFILGIMLCTLINAFCYSGRCGDKCEGGRSYQKMMKHGMGRPGMMIPDDRMGHGCGKGMMPGCSGEEACMQGKICSRGEACCMNRERMQCCIENEEACCMEEDGDEELIKDTIPARK